MVLNTIFLHYEYFKHVFSQVTTLFKSQFSQHFKCQYFNNTKQPLATQKSFPLRDGNGVGWGGAK